MMDLLSPYLTKALPKLQFSLIWATSDGLYQGIVAQQFTYTHRIFRRRGARDFLKTKYLRYTVFKCRHVVKLV